MDMRLVATFVFAAALLLPPATALAQPADSGAGSASAVADKPTDPDDVVTCRYEKMTGSNFTRRVCHTQREWRQMNVDAKDMLDRLDNGHQSNGPGGG
jgi:hypothetical protein